MLYAHSRTTNTFPMKSFSLPWRFLATHAALNTHTHTLSHKRINAQVRPTYEGAFSWTSEDTPSLMRFHDRLFLVRRLGMGFPIPFSCKIWEGKGYRFWEREPVGRDPLTHPRVRGGHPSADLNLFFCQACHFSNCARFSFCLFRSFQPLSTSSFT